MQFLFVVLMSVLVGASALPHLMQAPNRPSFSLRKNTDFSIVAIPKFLQKVVQIERKMASLEEEQKHKQLVAQEEASKSQEVKEAEEAATDEDATDRSENTDNPDDQAKKTAEVAAKNHGTILINDFDLQTCVCTDAHKMTCQIWVDGYCSTEDEFVDVEVKTDENESFNKHLRCKDSNHFSGSLPVRGGGVGKVNINYLDQKIEQSINLINHCGPIGNDTPTSDE